MTSKKQADCILALIEDDIEGIEARYRLSHFRVILITFLDSDDKAKWINESDLDPDLRFLFEKIRQLLKPVHDLTEEDIISFTEHGNSYLDSF